MLRPLVKVFGFKVSDSGIYILHESFLKAGGTIRQKVVSEEAIGIEKKLKRVKSRGIDSS